MKKMAYLFVAILFILACGTSAPQLTPTVQASPTIDMTAAIHTAIAKRNLKTTANAPTATPSQLPTDTLLPTPTIILGTSCIPNNITQTGKVVDVVDGDTIKVLFDQDGRTDTVRYIGLNTPGYFTTVEFFGAEAAIKNVRLVFGRNITLVKDKSERDDLGRLLRYALVDNIFVNYELIVEGYAHAVSSPLDSACNSIFEQAEQEAASSKLGLWDVPPTLVAIPTGAPQAAVCSCSGDLYNCTTDFSTHAQAQACFNYCVSIGAGDIHRLDGNNDGNACESLP